MPILVRDNGGKSIANSEDYNLAGDVTEIVDSLNVCTVVADQAAMDALTTFTGRFCLRLDEMAIYAFNGTWNRLSPRAGGIPYAMSAGSSTLNMGGTSGATVAVTFPAGRFTAPPVVTLGKAMSTHSKLVFYAVNVTASGFNLGAQTTDGTTTSITAGCTWQATQMTATSGVG